MRKLLIAILLAGAAFFALFYFELPLNLLRPVFHADIINQYAAEYHLDPLLVTALIKAESNFITRARSHRGAVGLMQLLPSTARDLGRDLGYKDLHPGDLEDSRINIRLGTYYLRRLKDIFNDNNILALAAYNAGLSKVQGWYYQNPMLGVEIADIPYPETRNYVRNVLRTYTWLKRIQSFKNFIRGKKPS